jgi:iron complex outermembrane receptor protein
VRSQTQLPEIVVVSPSPIVHRRQAPKAAPAVPGRSRETGRTRQAPAPTLTVTAAPARGTLPIVTDQFATVTVVPHEELRRNCAATLGDVLFSKPGITGSSFAPGASSRPIIRGLDVNRVGILENGLASGGASDLGEDHFVPIDPLSANQIEVIRGPATLRYGSQSIGGVVSTTNNRIPDSLPCVASVPLSDGSYPLKALAPAQTAPSCLSVETRSAATSVDNGLEGAILVDAGAGN